MAGIRIVGDDSHKSFVGSENVPNRGLNTRLSALYKQELGRPNRSAVSARTESPRCIQGDPYGRGIVYVDSKYEVAFSCKVGLLPRPGTEL